MAFKPLKLRPSEKCIRPWSPGLRRAYGHRNEMGAGPCHMPCHSTALRFLFLFFPKCSLEPTHWTPSPSNASDCLFTFCQLLSGLKHFLPSGKQTTSPGSISNTNQILASCMAEMAGTSQFSLHSSLLQNLDGY